MKDWQTVHGNGITYKVIKTSEELVYLHSDYLSWLTSQSGWFGLKMATASPILSNQANSFSIRDLCVSLFEPILTLSISVLM